MKKRCLCHKRIEALRRPRNVVNLVPGAKPAETPEETEERKRVAYCIKRRPRALSAMEHLVLNLFYAIERDTRATCGSISAVIMLPHGSDVHAMASKALEKIYYDKPHEHGPSFGANGFA